MLVNSSQLFNVGDIVGFKMISGDEIVGKIVSATDTSYELNKPWIVVTSADGVGLMPAMFSLDPDTTNLTIKEMHVIAKCKAHEKMHDHYLKITGAQG